jgi:RES domain-containing protein
MSEPIPRVSVKGMWFRHVHAGVGGLAVSRGRDGGRFNAPGQPALYLADSEPTAWAEWYRWLAEWAQSPADHLPRDLYRIAVELTEVADLRTMAVRQQAAAPARMRPSRRQWPSFQELGGRLAAEGMQGILYASAARTRASCLCVFETGIAQLRVAEEPVRVITAPPPPHGLRT